MWPFCHYLMDALFSWYYMYDLSFINLYMTFFHNPTCLTFFIKLYVWLFFITLHVWPFSLPYMYDLFSLPNMYMIESVVNFVCHTYYYWHHFSLFPGTCKAACLPVLLRPQKVSIVSTFLVSLVVSHSRSWTPVTLQLPPVTFSILFRLSPAAGECFSCLSHTLHSLLLGEGKMRMNCYCLLTFCLNFHRHSSILHSPQEKKKKGKYCDRKNVLFLSASRCTLWWTFIFFCLSS